MRALESCFPRKEEKIMSTETEADDTMATRFQMEDIKLSTTYSRRITMKTHSSLNRQGNTDLKITALFLVKVYHELRQSNNQSFVFTLRNVTFVTICQQ